MPSTRIIPQLRGVLTRLTPQRLARDSSGAVAIMAALAFPALIGGMALGTEVGLWYLNQRKLQQAADIAAYAAAVQLRAGRTQQEMWTAAAAVAERSGMRAGDQLVPRHPPASGARQGESTAVEITLTRQQTRFFTLIFDTEPVAISARAVAGLLASGNACLLALDPTANRAIQVSGSANVTFDACDIATNSSAADAFHMQGGAVRLTTGCIHSVGGATTTTALTLTSCAMPNVNAPATRDPYADVAQPAVSGSCQSGNIGQNNQSTTITPQFDHPSGLRATRFCGGLSPNGTVTFEPGLYIIDGGEFSLNAQTTVVGDGVVFLLTNGARMRFNGGATLNLTAPDAGPLAGLLFFGSRSDVGVQHVINGTATSQLNGAVYLPSGDLDYSGNFSGASGCTQVISRRITFIGNSSLSVNCAAAGTRPIPAAQTIALLE